MAHHISRVLDDPTEARGDLRGDHSCWSRLATSARGDDRREFERRAVELLTGTLVERTAEYHRAHHRGFHLAADSGHRPAEVIRDHAVNVSPRLIPSKDLLPFPSMVRLPVRGALKPNDFWRRHACRCGP